MKNLGKNIVTLFVGMLMGAALFGGAAQATEGFYKAVASTSAVYLDGQKVQLTAFAINGNNYVKLRDVGEMMDFNVYWDGGVQIDSDAPYTGEAPNSGAAAPSSAPVPVQQTAPAPSAPSSGQSYTISTDHWSREDFSQQANPAIFTGVYDRALYNTFRQTLVDGTSQNPAYTMVSKADYSIAKQLMGRLGGASRYEHHVPENFTNYWQYLDYFAVSAEMPENYQAPFDFIRPVIAEVDKLATDREKVTQLNDYLRTLLTYEISATSGITQTFAPHTGELQAACGSYARAMKFLCEAADIPCFTISTDKHTWNLVYADGQWLHVDISANDRYDSNFVLLVENYHSEKDDIAPEATAFLKELLVPGSTK